MIPEGNVKSNIERFSGFEGLYDSYRPQAPALVVDLLTGYLGGRPSLVVDVGCGTGLSSFIWRKAADRVVGIEPNGDMIGKAREKLALLPPDDTGRFAFVQGYSNELDLESGSADIVTCSQSFHWMDPVSTLQEVGRVLRPNGIFAAYDCDWPPQASWTVESGYERLLRLADEAIARRVPAADRAVKRDKGKHLENLRASGVFRYVKEMVFHNIERCDADRYIGLALSQGGVQTALKHGAEELRDEIDAFRKEVEAYFRGRTLDVMFGYRMRLGIK